MSPIRTATVTRVGAALAFLTWSGTPAVQAQSAFWNTAATAGGSWGDPSKWQGGTVPFGTGNAAAFVLNFDAGASVTLDGSRIIGTVISTSATPWSLDAGSGGGLVTSTFLVSGGGPLTVNIALSEVDLQKDGSGTLVLSNASNAFSGTINVRAGTLALTGSGNYAAGSSRVRLAAGTTLDVTGLNGGSRFGGATTRLAVNNGDTVDGTGTVNGGLKVSSGGTVYPGDDGVGALTVKGGVDFATGSIWKVKLSTANAGGPNTNNRIDPSAVFKLEDGANMPIDGSGLTFTAGQTYDYVIALGSSNYNIGLVNFQPTNIGPSEFASPAYFSLFTRGDALVLRFTPVPEPLATFLLTYLGKIRPLLRGRCPSVSGTAAHVLAAR